MELMTGKESALETANLAGCEIITAQGESGLSTAMYKVLNGKRVLMADMAYPKQAALSRLPVIGISPKISNWSINFLPASSQETIDHLLAAISISENKKVLIPAVIKLDHLLENTREIVDMPSQKMISNIIGKHPIDKPEKHLRMNLEDSLESKATLQKIAEEANKSYKKLAESWKKRFKRKILPLEAINCEDAERIIVSYGSNCGNAMMATKKLREQGEKVGFVKISLLRPWPQIELEKALTNAKSIAVVDSQFSLGGWSPLYSQILTTASATCANIISNDLVSTQQFTEIFSYLKNPKKERVWLI